MDLVSVLFFFASVHCAPSSFCTPQTMTKIFKDLVPNPLLRRLVICDNQMSKANFEKLPFLFPGLVELAVGHKTLKRRKINNRIKITSNFFSNASRHFSKIESLELYHMVFDHKKANVDKCNSSLLSFVEKKGSDLKRLIVSTYSAETADRLFSQETASGVLNSCSELKYLDFSLLVNSNEFVPIDSEYLSTLAGLSASNPQCLIIDGRARIQFGALILEEHVSNLKRTSIWHNKKFTRSTDSFKEYPVYQLKPEPLSTTDLSFLISKLNEQLPIPDSDTFDDEDDYDNSDEIDPEEILHFAGIQQWIAFAMPEISRFGFY
jgi:hypothetical protein